MGESGTEHTPANRMWERGEESDWKLWALIHARRWALVAAGSVASWLVLLALARWAPSSMEKLLDTDNIPTLFSSIVSSMITTVTLILTVTQLILSEEIGPLFEQERRLDEQTDFRSRVEETLGVDVSPMDPAEFLGALVDETRRCATTLRDAAATDADDELAQFAEEVIEHSDQATDRLEEGSFGSFSVLMVALDYNYSRKLHDARRFRADESLSTDREESLDDLIEVLQHYGPARGFFKSIYFQWELIEVSRSMIYATLPGLAVSGYMILLFDPTQLAATLFTIPLTYLVVCSAYVVALVPFFLLLAYILRVLTILKRTLAPGEFVLRSED